MVTMHAEKIISGAGGSVRRALAVTVTVMVGLAIIAGGVTWAVLNKLSPPGPVAQAQHYRNRQNGQPTLNEELRPLEWWENCVLYQVYLRSYRDSDGDGIGDLNGLTERLDHLADAGVNALWVTPIFTSPQMDMGYDVSDFYSIHYQFGTMQDFERLIAKAHSMGIKILLDMVPNHCSVESEYFKKSVKRIGEYEDFFVWSDGLPDPNNASNRLPPSNWLSVFGGKSWEWNNERKQFYLHQFSVAQPDFNMRNPMVRKEIANIFKFWLDKGLDGFRLDSMPYLIEMQQDANGRYPDNPVVPYKNYDNFQIGYTLQQSTKDRIETWSVLYEWREFLDEYNEEHGGDTRIFVSEGYSNISTTMLYYDSEDGRCGAHFPFNFGFIIDANNATKAKDFALIIQRWLTYMPYGKTANWVIGNHDNPRMATRFGEHMVDGLVAMEMILPGVACTYQGEEIGMKDSYVSWEDTMDVLAWNLYTPETYLEHTRDTQRTPFLWDDTKNAGFSSATKTWLPIDPDYKEHNLAKQKRDTISHFKVYQKMTTLRKEKTLSHGRTEVGTLSINTLYVVRHLRGHDTLALVFNMGKTVDTVQLDHLPYLTLPATIYISSTHSAMRESYRVHRSQLTLTPGEALVLRAPPVACY